MSKGANKIIYTYYDGREITKECLLNKTSEDNKLQELLQGNRIRSIHSSEPTLNDIFIEVTGRVLQ
jgi:fluoroquinolone transport system ATP-binding protein